MEVWQDFKSASDSYNGLNSQVYGIMRITNRHIPVDMTIQTVVNLFECFINTFLLNISRAKEMNQGTIYRLEHIFN